MVKVDLYSVILIHCLVLIVEQLQWYIYHFSDIRMNQVKIMKIYLALQQSIQILLFQPGKVRPWGKQNNGLLSYLKCNVVLRLPLQCICLMHFPEKINKTPNRIPISWWEGS
ncbi:hypothetical protein ANANG_G00177270 [Anguilla anguilla]|uniref:Uncharacterized protein n=1 Tax=Anguilla anguilla TaxID=7936 RepID=A0A9D3M4K1_ANGAN|nr:hypothetical protein ANANG_G00177270 [Anguilla anguilla]